MKDACKRKEEPEIVIIGASILDVLAYPADEEVFRTGSSPAEDIRLSVGGDALNEATVLARLGMKVLLETVIGSGKAGKFILDHCRDCGILLPADCVREDFSTGINVVLVSRDGSRHFLTNPYGSLRRLTLQDIHMPFPQSAKIVCFASIFVFPEIGPKELEVIFRTAGEQGKIVCADMTKRKKNETVEELAEALSYVDYLIPNDEEAMLITGENTVEEAAESLRRAGVKTVVVKCGSKGCYVCGREKCFWVPAEKNVKCVDTTGAGDSFMAGFLYALFQEKNLRDCARNGNYFGGKAVAVTGATDWLVSHKKIML
ncbi:MAG TPA: carbohydrate kinase family protein [Candidatus Blautia excrementigallinarum]|nr:carbohydrate kinase family protein [Candidatus Blautia excrementigallinarum]